MKRTSLVLSAIMVLALISCKNGNKQESDKKSSDQKSEMKESSKKDAMDEEKSQITLTKWTKGPEYKDAGLKLSKPGKMELSKGSADFAFDVKNYELGTQTKGPGPDMLANSKKGQHIHFIVDNKPYTAHYENKFSKDLGQGDHVVLAFLSRSYHEAVKNDNSYVVKQFRVGDVDESDQMDVDFSKEHMFYSRPKGTYSGDGTNKVILDFFLLNTELSADGNKVEAKINDQEFTIDEWAPYVMEGLPMGENTVKLKLVDSDGNYIEGPFNKVERTFTLKK